MTRGCAAAEAATATAAWFMLLHVGAIKNNRMDTDGQDSLAAAADYSDEEDQSTQTKVVVGYFFSPLLSVSRKGSPYVHLLVFFFYIRSM